jgi:hypothetical protein
MRASVIAFIVGAPAFWFALVFLIGWVWPNTVQHLKSNVAFVLGAALGSIAIVLDPLSKKGRADFSDDFEEAYGRFYKEENAPSNSDDQMISLDAIAGIDKLQREAVLADGIDLEAIAPEIGRNIMWIDVVRQVFRVLEFNRGTTEISENDTVKTTSHFAPYGYLIVESPVLSQPVRMPIVHRDDFRLAASVFDEPTLVDAIDQAAELLVTYAPKRYFPSGKVLGLSHALHYVIVPRGTIDRYYEIYQDTHMANLALEKLFGEFVYQGQLRVQVNPEPEL